MIGMNGVQLELFPEYVKNHTKNQQFPQPLINEVQRIEAFRKGEAIQNSVAEWVQKNKPFLQISSDELTSTNDWLTEQKIPIFDPFKGNKLTMVERIVLFRNAGIEEQKNNFSKQKQIK